MNDDTQRRYNMQRQWSDAEAYLDFPGEPPIATERVTLNLCKMTASPPLLRGNPIPDQMVLGHIKRFKDCLFEDTRFYLAQKGDDIPKNPIDRCPVVLGLQNGPQTQKAFHDFFNSGVSVIQLTYEGENRYGGGWRTPEVPLTREGENALHACLELGLILDLSHSGHRTARDILDFIERTRIPLHVMVSHTGCYEVYKHLRNLPLDVLERVARLGGVIGVYTLTFGLHKTDESMGPFLAHLKAILDKCGKNSVCIGSDGAYRYADTEALERHLAKMGTLVNIEAFGAKPQDHPMDMYSPHKLPHLVDLLTPVVGETTVWKIVGENLHNFFRGSLPRF